MSKYTDAFDRLCGDCTGLDILIVTEKDVHDQGNIYHATKEEREMALRGLEEYQDMVKDEMYGKGKLICGACGWKFTPIGFDNFDLYSNDAVKCPLCDCSDLEPIQTDD